MRLVSFGRQASIIPLGAAQLQVLATTIWLKGSILNPLNFSFLRQFFWADVIHLHQINTLVADLSCLAVKILRKKIFMTDHGGGGEVVLNGKMPWLHNHVTGILQSEFTRNFLPLRLQEKAVVIKGGVDIERFSPQLPVVKNNSILYVGRILPHKGINYLVEAIRQLKNTDLHLKIVGRIYDSRFYEELKKLAEGLNVKFIHEAADDEIVRYYREAEVVVLPSVHTDVYGNYTATPELMGFTLTEAQACGTPVICTNAGAMPEFVQDGVTGRVILQNSSSELTRAILEIISLSSHARQEMSRACRAWAETFSWERVAHEHHLLYQLT